MSTDDHPKRVLPTFITPPNVLQDIHQFFTPHPGQINVLNALFFQNKKLIFVQCGRKWGKTALVIYALWRWCASLNDQSCYYIAPFSKQAREILWASNRLQRFGPLNWVKKTYQHEMRIVFWNDSFIKIEGADNTQALAGINPHFVVYDEQKDHDPMFHMSMAPNLTTFQAPLLIVGSPPYSDVLPNEVNYLQLAEEARIRSRGFFYTGPSWERRNDPLFLEELMETKKVLIARGERDVWDREYGGKFVKAGGRFVFPMFENYKGRHVQPHEVVMSEVRPRMYDLDYWCVCDPGTTSVFAVGFFAIDWRQHKIYVLDEIYETDISQCSARIMWPRIQAKVQEIYPHDYEWSYGYDEGAAWFPNEVPGNWNWLATNKMSMKKETGEVKPYLGLIKDLLNYNIITFSSHVKKGTWELSVYQLDDTGKISKKNDHFIDILRYLLGLSFFRVENTRFKNLNHREALAEELPITKMEEQIEAELYDPEYLEIL